MRGKCNYTPAKWDIHILRGSCGTRQNAVMPRRQIGTCSYQRDLAIRPAWWHKPDETGTRHYPLSAGDSDVLALERAPLYDEAAQGGAGTRTA